LDEVGGHPGNEADPQQDADSDAEQAVARSSQAVEVNSAHGSRLLMVTISIV
jgi:hypothetical protein